MKRLIFTIINMLLVLVCLGIGFYAYNSAGRYFASGIVYVAPLYGERDLQTSDAENLQISFHNYTFNTVYQSVTWLVSSNSETPATVIHTNNIPENAIEVNEPLAWRLFGTIENVEGVSVRIGDTPYIVTNVRTSGEEYTAWLRHEPQMPITAMYIHSYPQDPLAQTTARAMLTSIGRSPANFAIVEIDRLVESIGIRYRVFMYVICLVALVFFLLMFFAQKKWIVLIPVVFFMIAIIWGVNDILRWLPNLSALFDDQTVFSLITATRMLPSDTQLCTELLRVSQLNRLANYGLVVGSVAFVNVVFFGVWSGYGKN